MKYLNVNFNIKLSVVLLLIGWIVSAVIYLAFFSEENTVEKLKLFFIINGAGFLIFSTYIQWKISLETISFNNKQLKFQKDKLALDLLVRWDNEEMKYSREYYRETRKTANKLSKDEIINKINEDKAHTNSLVSIANYFEDIEQSINYELATEEILRAGLKPLVNSIADTYAIWFQNLKKDDEAYYKQFGAFMNLLDRWK